MSKAIKVGVWESRACSLTLVGEQSLLSLVESCDFALRFIIAFYCVILIVFRAFFDIVSSTFRMFPRVNFVIVLLFSAIAIIPDEKIALEDTTTRMLERAEEMRRMQVEIETMFYNIEHPSPEPALTDVLPTPAPPEMPSTWWLAIAQFFPTHTLLTPIFFFWYLRNSGGRWMSFLYMLGIDLEWSLGHDSCLFKMFAIALLFLHVANIFRIRLNFGWFRRRTQKRAPSNPEMKRQPSNTADPPHQDLSLQLSTPRFKLRAVQESGTFSSVFQDDSAIIIVQQTTRSFMMELDRSIFEIGPQITSINSMMEVDSAIISAYPQSCAITSPLQMCSPGSLISEDSSIITVLSNVPQSTSFHDLMAEDSAIIALSPQSCAMASPLARCTSSSLMDEDSSIVAVLSNEADNGMAEDSAIIAVCPQRCTIASPQEICTSRSLMEQDSSIVAVFP